MKHKLEITDLNYGKCRIVNEDGATNTESLLASYLDEVEDLEEYESLIDALIEDSKEERYFYSEGVSLTIGLHSVKAGHNFIQGVVVHYPKKVILHLALQRYGQLTVYKKNGGSVIVW